MLKLRVITRSKVGKIKSFCTANTSNHHKSSYLQYNEYRVSPCSFLESRSEPAGGPECSCWDQHCQSSGPAPHPVEILPLKYPLVALQAQVLVHSGGRAKVFPPISLQTFNFPPISVQIFIFFLAPTFLPSPKRSSFSTTIMTKCRRTNVHFKLWELFVSLELGLPFLL